MKKSKAPAPSDNPRQGDTNKNRRQAPAESPPVSRISSGSRSPGRPPTGGDLTRRITVTIRESQIEALDAIADREGVTRSEVIRRVIDAAPPYTPRSSPR